ncbi:MAG: radical SAM protein [Gammaproteobacteria bacterium]|nr:radical SAM protein [Gammaproteobacteria bacterium]
MNDLYLIAINLTHRCNLACAHCYMDAKARLDGGDGELSTQEVYKLLDEISTRSDETMVVLTGGEPLVRSDLEQLVEHGNQLGLSMVVGTNGVLLTEQRAQSLQSAGAMGVGISLDSLDPASHDSFRGADGSWEKTLAAMDYCRNLGLPFQVHFSITENNAHELPAMIDFAKAAGAHVLNIFFLVCTGRGETMSNITPEHYETVLRQLVQAQEVTKDLIIRARCAPHFKRVAYQHDPQSTLTRAEGYEGGGCLAGLHYCRITPEGGVTACPYIPTEEGSIRQQPFWQIWDQGPGFRQLRTPQLQGKCGECEYQKLCIGCRARPLAMGGSLMDADPWCSHHPTGQPIIQPYTEPDTSRVTWSPEAEQRLQRVPGFLRKMVRKRAEEHVRKQGETRVTTEHMQTLAQQRFGNGFPGKKPTLAETDQANSKLPGTTLAWTQEAIHYLEDIPSFLRDGILQVAEDVARQEGRLEVNIQLLTRLEEDGNHQRNMEWEPGAENLLATHLSDRPVQVSMFVQPSLEAAAEREAGHNHRQLVTRADMEVIIATDLAGVTWDKDALLRVESAPDFIRAGIKKAAEFNARREGLNRITTQDLTRFRNHAMLRAVKRMKSFGMADLNFDAYSIAQEKVPRLQQNPQADRRFSEIRNYVESKISDGNNGLGVLDRSLLEQMRAELKREPSE